jgi:heat-inducible transcriptional repressor
MPDSILDERKKSILRAIVEDYIHSGEPVGSRTISRHYDLGISSATIRNDMSDLEEMGYLVQPHTSAGRIPSEKGYRLYVDQLMKLSEMSMEEVQSIKQNMEMKIIEMDRLIRKTSLVLSLITDYVSLVTTPNFTRSALKAIQVVPLDAGKALVVAVAEAGAVRNTLVNS